MSSPRIVRLEKSRLLILPGQTVNGCGAVWPSEFFTTLLGPMCLGAGYVAPLILGFAWFLAAKIVGGGLPLE